MRCARSTEAWVLALGLVLGCPPPTTQPAPAPPTAAPETEAKPATCGPRGEVIERYDWVPPTVRLLGSVRTDADDVEATLAAVKSAFDGDTRGLPIYAAFDLAQLEWEVPAIEEALHQAGFFPAELVRIYSESGVPAWVWGSTCDLDEAMGRAESAWSVTPRRTPAGAVATPGEGDFPFDAVFLPGDRMALVPAGRSGAFRDWLQSARIEVGASDGAHPGDELEALDAAPLRVVLGGRSLLGAGAKPSATGLRKIRATAAGLEIDGTMVADGSPP